MILVINLCREKLHEFEFVKPVLKLISDEKLVKKYGDVFVTDLEKADKVIICGTSLEDDLYLENISKFEWLKNFDKPVLGICAGAQVINLVFGGKVQKIKEIGQIDILFDKEFLGVGGKQKVYSLHKNFVSSDEFEIYGSSIKCSHATKHKDKEIYNCLFHPEVYNKEIILNFLK